MTVYTARVARFECGRRYVGETHVQVVGLQYERDVC